MKKSDLIIKKSIDEEDEKAIKELIDVGSSIYPHPDLFKPHSGHQPMLIHNPYYSGVVLINPIEDAWYLDFIFTKHDSAIAIGVSLLEGVVNLSAKELCKNIFWSSQLGTHHKVVSDYIMLQLSQKYTGQMLHQDSLFTVMYYSFEDMKNFEKCFSYAQKRIGKL